MLQPGKIKRRSRGLEPRTGVGIKVKKPASHKWNFRQHLRTRAFGWRGSKLAIRRLKEAASEIRAVARRDLVLAADGAVGLIERIWPSFEHIDTSSGALGSAVNRTLGELIPFIAAAPADRGTRDQWLDRLWQAVLDDGVSYLSPVEEAWGDLCASPEVASRWADEILPLLRTAWSDPRPGSYVRGTAVCLASLLAAERHDELLEVLSLNRHPIWPWRRYGIRALVAEGRLDDALTYAEASRGLNIPDVAVDAECEEVLIAAGRREEAYRQYGLTANQAGTGLATFRQIVKKYPEINPKQILTDLADSSGDTGKWFAAAKDAGHLDMAVRFATAGHTDPRTLSRACRDFLESEPVFSLRVGRLAVERILAGDGFDITALDLSAAVDHFLEAAGRLGVAADAQRDLAQMLAAHPETPPFYRTPILRRVGTSPPTA
jgi:tetratricopeptide (TPR) repeat protein